MTMRCAAAMATAPSLALSSRILALPPLVSKETRTRFPRMETSTAGAALAEGQLTRPGMMRGARDMAGTLLPVAAFGIAFGAAAVATGMSLASATAISALVFAGASPFPALEVCSSRLPFLPLDRDTVAFHHRHTVPGATLPGR